MGAAFLALALMPVWGIATPAVFAIGIGFYMLHNTLQTVGTQMTPQARGTSVSLFASVYFLGQTAGAFLAAPVAIAQDKPMRVRGEIVAIDGPMMTVKSRDGKELYFIAPDGMLMAASVRYGAKLEIGEPKPLFPTGTPGAFGFNNGFELDELHDVSITTPLALQVLRFANSSMYAGLSSLATLRQALMRLGTHQVMRLSFAAAQSGRPAGSAR